MKSDTCHVCRERVAVETLNGERVCGECNPSCGPLRWCPWADDVKGADCPACRGDECATCDATDGDIDECECEHDTDERHEVKS